HERVPRAKAAQRLAQLIDQVTTAHAKQLVLGIGGVGERPENIEDGSEAELAPHGLDMTHRGVQQGRVAEADAQLADARLDDRYAYLDVDAQLLDRFRTAARTGHAPVTVLGDRYPAGGDDQSGRRADIESREGVA